MPAYPTRKPATPISSAFGQYICHVHPLKSLRYYQTLILKNVCSKNNIYSSHPFTLSLSYLWELLKLVVSYISSSLLHPFPKLPLFIHPNPKKGVTLSGCRSLRRVPIYFMGKYNRAQWKMSSWGFITLHPKRGFRAPTPFRLLLPLPLLALDLGIVELSDFWKSDDTLNGFRHKFSIIIGNSVT